MKYFAGMMAAVLLVAAATVGGYRVWDKATHTRDDNGGVLGGNSSPPVTEVPANGQVIVDGTITAVHFEGAALGRLATPFTVTTASRGQGGATITPVTVGGSTTSIDWQAGQPLPINGDGGGLSLGPVTIDATTDAISIGLDGVHGVSQGTYTLGSSVAVGSQPKDTVKFTATDKTTVEFRGGASTPFPSTDLSTNGNGTATLEGTLVVTYPDRMQTPFSTLNFDGGDWTLTLTPAAEGGYTVHAVLQGPVH